MSDWPKRPDGSNMSVGEMTSEDRKRVMRDAAQRFKEKWDVAASVDARDGVPSGRPLRGMVRS